MECSSPKVLFATYECAPFYKAGGLGDVAGSLPVALHKLGLDIRVVLPLYPVIEKNYPGLKKILTTTVNVGGEALSVDIYEGQLPASSVPVYFIANKYFAAGDLFDADSRFRFVLFSFLVTEIGRLLSWSPTVIHCHDWHTAAVPLFVKKHHLTYQTIFTIHNLGYQGETPLPVLERFSFQQQDFSQLKKNNVNLMREAILQSDVITTVSPTYAQEILTPKYGYGLESVLSTRRSDLYGILNGLDYNFFNPALDPHISFPYSETTLDLKIKNKLYLQKISGLRVTPDTPLFGLISRLAGQKGFDILAETFSRLMALDIQLVILGTGEAKYEQLFTGLASAHPTKFKFYNLFDAALANQIYAGADIFLMPSLYEPCGLGQMIAMKYGTLPLVRSTGGLKDTILPVKLLNLKRATGFVFQNYTASELFATVEKAVSLYAHQKTWRRIQVNALKADFSWDRSAQKYLNIYQAL